MAWSWVWGDKKPPVKKVEVETLNEDVPKRVTLVGVKMDIALEHPIDKNAVPVMLDAKMQFLLKEGNTVKEARITNIEVLS